MTARPLAALLALALVVTGCANDDDHAEHEHDDDHDEHHAEHEHDDDHDEHHAEHEHDDDHCR